MLIEKVAYDSFFLFLEVVSISLNNFQSINKCHPKEKKKAFYHCEEKYIINKLKLLFFVRFFISRFN